jgi:hypothetical protein
MAPVPARVGEWSYAVLILLFRAPPLGVSVDGSLTTHTAQISMAARFVWPNISRCYAMSSSDRNLLFGILVSPLTKLAINSTFLVCC